MDNMQAIMVIAVATAVTVLLRFLPFIVFSGDKETPEVITYLGKVLPYAIMAMLVVYCLKGTVVTAFPYGIPEVSFNAVAFNKAEFEQPGDIIIKNLRLFY